MQREQSTLTSLRPPAQAGPGAIPTTFSVAAKPEGSSTSLLRALEILELIANKSGGFSNGEISRRLKMATSTTSYILSRLESQGYIKRNGERGRYEIGLKVIALAHGALREMGLRKAAEPVLHRLVAQTRQSGIVAVLERGLVMIVDKVEQSDLIKLDMDIGVRYPAHTTALGKVLLAHLPEEERAQHCLGCSAKMSKNAGDAYTKLLSELATVKKRGYATSHGELFLGVWAVAAPIIDSTGTVRAAVSATGTRAADQEEEVISATMRCAKEISLRLATAESSKPLRM